MRLLGDLSADEFLSNYWQQELLLIRGALPDYRSPVSADELAGLALEPEVESRLVHAKGVDRIRDHRWELQPGPFNEADFAELPEANWTLLVQAVDLWVPAVAELLQRFDFLPRWRLDDVMVSFATPGGGVGPHVDQYDVFLLQVEGERDWSVAATKAKAGAPTADGSLQPGSSLRVLQNFEPVQQWTLAPGDMLYLPPGVPHWGVARTDCLTFSIGFRSPSASEMLSDLAVEVLARNSDHRYRDPPLTAAMAADEIAPEFLQGARAMLLNLLDNEALLADWFARFMTCLLYTSPSPRDRG